MRLHTWGLAAALRARGLTVVETAGWASRSHGELPSNPTVVWHHDASPPGDSPGALGWMISNWDNASAQIWINRQGVVHLVGSGVAWHAGRVMGGSEQYDNFHAIGIETDHTIFEDWPEPLLYSLRATTAVILDIAGRARTEFSFHREICSPPGRKLDPAGLDLDTERAAVYAFKFGPANRSDRPELPPKHPTDAPPVDVPNPPAPAGPAFAGRNLSQGMKGEDVRVLQSGLNRHARNLGRVLLVEDGDFGRNTYLMLQAYQRARGGPPFRLADDGIVGPATWASLWR